MLSAKGLTVATCLVYHRGTVQPGMHALVGATAMLGGVFRTSISLVNLHSSTFHKLSTFQK